MPKPRLIIVHLILSAALCAAAPALASSQQTLSADTLAEFNRFIARAERDMERRSADGSAFLWMEEDRARLEEARTGDVVIESLEGDADLDDAMIHNWIGGMFVPNVTIDDMLSALLDYDRYPDIYQGIIDARLLSRNGSSDRIYERLRREDLVLDTWHEAGYQRLDRNRATTWSRSTQVREVRNPGAPNEQLLPDGQGRGYLWRINVYWRFEQRANGVFAECHSISLSRDIPYLVRFIVAPFVRRIPRQALEQSLAATKAEAQRVARTARQVE